MPDFIQNGVATGDVASRLLHHGMDPAALRPWVEKDGRSYVTVNMGNGNTKAVLLQNAATLRKDEWIQLDTAIVKVAKERLRLVADLRGKGLTYGIANGMGKTVLQTEAQSDITDAVISMDPIRESPKDRPVNDLVSLPLPVIHKDFFYTARQLAASRNGGSPLDTTTAELAARRVSEQAEKLLLGTSGSYAYGGGTIYGYTNYPDRLTKVMTTPTGSNGGTTTTEVLAMIAQAFAVFHYGPYMLYHSPNWAQFLDADYSTAKGDNTLRDRLRKIEQISDVAQSDFLTGYQMLLVQMTQDVVREVVGMDLTTVQWETKGGMQVNFKVMAILVPQIRSDCNSNTGIVHGTAP